jgi:predicted Zn-dependent peptidase
MHGLVITADNVENQRQAVKEERRLRGDNQAYGNTSEKLEELVYDNFAYHHSVIGSMEDLDAANVDDVKQFFKTYYAPNNAVLSLVGDLDTAATLAKVKKYFGGIQRQPPPTPADLAEQPKTEQRRATINDSLARLTRIDIAYRIPPSGTPDAQALQVAAQILGGGGGGFGGRGGGGGNNSRLYLKLVQEKELVANVSANAERRAGPGMFHISATLRPGVKPEEVEGLIGEEIARLHSEPVTAKELGRVRINQLRAAENRTTALARAQALADATAVFDDPNRVNTDPEAVMKISGADVQRAAKANLTKANSVVLITQPTGGAQGGGRRGGR